MLAKISMTLSIVLALLVGFLFYKISKKNTTTLDIPEVAVAEAFTGEGGPRATVTAYLNGDSLNSQYKFITEKSGQLEAKMRAAEEKVKKAYGPRQAQWEKNMAYAQQHPEMSETEAAALQGEMDRLQKEMDDIQEREVGALKKTGSRLAGRTASASFHIP